MVSILYQDSGITQTLMLYLADGNIFFEVDMSVLEELGVIQSGC